MQDSFDFQSLVKKYPELPYALFAILSYTISVIFAVTEMGGTMDFYGIEIHTISTPLWIIFGLASIYFLYEAFFDMWIYAIHLIFAYFLSGAGFLALYVFRGETIIQGLGLALVLVGLGFIIYFVYRIGNIRSYRILNSTEPETARERFSLHSWYMYPFMFYVITAISFIDLGYWYENPDHSPILHILSEVSLIMTLVYLLWKPENILFYGTREAGDEAGDEDFAHKSTHSRLGEGSPEDGDGAETRTEKGSPSSSMASNIKRSRKVENCPGFDSPPLTTRKSCPNCGTANDFAWCPQSEEYLIDCPACERKTYHGRKVCIHCKSRLKEIVGCSSCGEEFPIRRFKEIS